MSGDNNEQGIDWGGIERDYRAGIMTLRAIGDKYGITHGAVRKRAKRDEWDRDLSAKIKAKAEALVSKALVSKEVSNAQKDAEKATVETAAQLQANVILSHRVDIGRYRRLCDTLLVELEIQTGAILTFEQLETLMVEKDDLKLAAQYRKALSTSTRIDGAKKLVETFKTLIGLERQAFGLADNFNGDANQPNQKQLPDLDDKTLAAKLAGIFALSKARAGIDVQ